MYSVCFIQILFSVPFIGNVDNKCCEEREQIKNVWRYNRHTTLPINVISIEGNKQQKTIRIIATIKPNSTELVGKVLLFLPPTTLAKNMTKKNREKNVC